METFLYTVIPALYQFEGGPEAQVGDQVKLYLDTEAQPGFPEFITGVIQHPIVRVCDGTQYSIEYDPDALDGAAELLVTGDVVSALVVSAVDVLKDYVDATFALRTRTVNGQALSGNVVLDHADVGASPLGHQHPTSDITDASATLIPDVAVKWSAMIFVTGLTGGAFQFNGWYGLVPGTLINNAPVWEHSNTGDVTMKFNGTVWVVESALILSAPIATALSGGFPYPWDVTTWTMSNVAYGSIKILVSDVGRYRDPVGPLILQTRAVTSNTDGIPDKLIAATPAIFPQYTVGTLPLATDYPFARAFVTDCVQALPTHLGTAGFTGGGTNKTPVFSDGTVWIIG